MILIFDVRLWHRCLPDLRCQRIRHRENRIGQIPDQRRCNRGSWRGRLAMPVLFLKGLKNPPPVRLARETVEGFISRGEVPHPKNIPSEMKGKAGVFVSLHKHDEYAAASAPSNRPNLISPRKLSAMRLRRLPATPVSIRSLPPELPELEIQRRYPDGAGRDKKRKGPRPEKIRLRSWNPAGAADFYCPI